MPVDVGKSSCRGCGLEPVLNLSHTVVNLAPVCTGDKVTASVFVRNTSPVEQVMTPNETVIAAA